MDQVEKTETRFLFENIPVDELTDAMVDDSAALFSRSYGVWSKDAEEKVGSFAKYGRRVRMSAERIRIQSLPKGASNFYARVLADDQLAGHAFATRWDYEGRSFCWITQLCVDPKWRRHGLATMILNKLREGQNDQGFGILSSHPAAILAALRAFGRGLEEVNLGMAQQHARRIMDSCPVTYVKEAKLRGDLFEPDAAEGVICCADTNFWVDHAEPLEVLKAVKERNLGWPFGDLPDGHEFVVIVKAAEVDSEGLRVRKNALSLDF